MCRRIYQITSEIKVESFNIDVGGVKYFKGIKVVKEHNCDGRFLNISYIYDEILITNRSTLEIEIILREICFILIELIKFI